MTLLIAMSVAAAVLLWPVPRSPAGRLRALVTGGRGERAPGTAEGRSGGGVMPALKGMPAFTARWDRLVLAAVPGLAGFAVISGVPGLFFGALLAGAALVAAGRREPVEARRRRARIAADLPFAIDLLVACLRAGQPVDRAVEVTADAIGGPLAERMSWVAVQLRLGADPGTAWVGLADEPPAAPFARTMIRAAKGGAPVADVLVRLADDARQAARAASSAAARKVGVQVVAPLGLCFLPAFVLLGIIPMIAGLIARIPLP